MATGYLIKDRANSRRLAKKPNDLIMSNMILMGTVKFSILYTNWSYCKLLNFHRFMMVTYISLQLAGLYQDPEGNTVFGDHAAQEPGVQPEPSSASFQLNTSESGAGSVKSLQKKILQLEEELSQANLKAAAS